MTSTCRDSVSSLWTRLVDQELAHVKQTADLRCRLLSLPTGTLDWDASAGYFAKIVEYAESGASKELQRLLAFINDLASGDIDAKSAEKAAKLRLAGNRLYKTGDLVGSARAYRRGLLHAPSCCCSADADHDIDREAALLHGNLSAVLHRQSLWKASLWELLTALGWHATAEANRPQSGLADGCVKRLCNRLHSCCRQLGVSLDVDDTGAEAMKQIDRLRNWLVLIEADDDTVGSADPATPRYGFSEQYPGLSAGLTVATSPTQGRYIVASADFAPGDVVAFEPASGWPPSAHVTPTEEEAGQRLLLLPSQRADHCSACLTRLHAVGHVCAGCCEAAFCAPPSACFRRLHGGRWLTSASAGFKPPDWHKAECRFMFLLNSIGLGHLCFRLALLRRLRLAQGLWPCQTDTSGMPTIDHLVDHFTEFSTENLFIYALTGWLISMLLAKTDYFLVPREKQVLAEGVWCFDTLRRLQCNAHAVTCVSDAGEEEDLLAEGGDGLGTLPKLCQVRLATGLFPCVSLFNHSCEPSVCNGFEGAFITLRCTKPIRRGDEVFNCYGPHYLHTTSPAVRRMQLQEQYFFECTCPHCVGCNSSKGRSVVGNRALVREWEACSQKALDYSPAGNCHSTKELHSLYTELTTAYSRLACPDCARPHCQLADNDDHTETPGSIIDHLGRRLLLNAATPSFSSRQPDGECLNLGLWCLGKSVAWARQHYGAGSLEFVWELIGLARAAYSVGRWPSSTGNPAVAELLLPGSPRELEAVVLPVLGLHYGGVKAKAMWQHFVLGHVCK